MAILSTEPPATSPSRALDIHAYLPTTHTTNHHIDTSDQLQLTRTLRLCQPFTISQLPHTAPAMMVTGRGSIAQVQYTGEEAAIEIKKLLDAVVSPQLILTRSRPHADTLS
jgi:hypothetical protein